jgi:MA3 domain
MAILREYLESGDAEEAAACIGELQLPQYDYYIVKRALTLAMDRHDREREAVSLLLSNLYGAGISPTQMIKARRGAPRATFHVLSGSVCSLQCHGTFADALRVGDQVGGMRPFLDADDRLATAAVRAVRDTSWCLLSDGCCGPLLEAGRARHRRHQHARLGLPVAVMALVLVRCTLSRCRTQGALLNA